MKKKKIVKKVTLIPSSILDTKMVKDAQNFVNWSIDFILDHPEGYENFKKAMKTKRKKV